MVTIVSTEPPFAAYGQRLKAARKAKGLKAKDVYTTLGLPQSTYSSWERGLSTPPLATATEIAKLLGVAVAVLTGEGAQGGTPEEEGP